MRSTLLSFLVFLSSFSFAQDGTSLKFGVHAGTILTQYVPGNEPTSFGGLAGGGQVHAQYYNKYTPGAFAGVSLWGRIAGHFGFHAEADYTRLHQHISYVESSAGMFGSNKDSADFTYKATALMIPAGIVVGDHHIGFTWGLYLDLPLACNVKTGYRHQENYTSSTQTWVENTYYDDEIKWMPKTDIGTYLAFNTAFRLTENLSISLATRYGRGFKLIDYPNYRNKFFIINAGVITKL